MHGELRHESRSRSCTRRRSKRSFHRRFASEFHLLSLKLGVLRWSHLREGLGLEGVSEGGRTGRAVFRAETLVDEGEIQSDTEGL